MLWSKKTLDRRVTAAISQGRQEYMSDLKAWHKRVTDRQAEVEVSFDLHAVKQWDVNVWDDFEEGGETYAYVKMADVPDNAAIDLLLHLLSYAKNNDSIANTGVKVGLRFYDSSAVYPSLIGRRDGEYALFKRWELTFMGVDYPSLEVIVSELKQADPFMGKTIRVCSES